MSEFFAGITLGQILSSATVAGGVSGLLAWVAKRYLDRKLEEERAAHKEELEKLKAENQRLVEMHRARVRNSEVFFNRQMEACDEIHKLCQSMLPRYKYPTMEWPDAVEEMSSEVERVEEQAQRIYTEYYAVLPDSVLGKLNAAVGYAGEAKFEIQDSSLSSRGHDKTESTFNELSEAAAKTKELLDGQRHSLIEPPMKNSH